MMNLGGFSYPVEMSFAAVAGACSVVVFVNDAVEHVEKLRKNLRRANAFLLKLAAIAIAYPGRLMSRLIAIPLLLPSGGDDEPTPPRGGVRIPDLTLKITSAVRFSEPFVASY